MQEAIARYSWTPPFICRLPSPHPLTFIWLVREYTEDSNNFPSTYCILYNFRLNDLLILLQILIWQYRYLSISFLCRVISAEIVTLRRLTLNLNYCKPYFPRDSAVSFYGQNWRGFTTMKTINFQILEMSLRVLFIGWYQPIIHSLP